MKKSTLAYLLSTTFAFNNSPSWKLDENGAIVMKDGNPVYLDSNGAEMVVQTSTITRLNGEAKTHREAKEAAEAKLKEFEGLDAKAAREAITKLKDVDLKKLVDSGEIEKVKSQIQAEVNKQLEEKDNHAKTLQSQLDNMLIGNIFNGSDFVRDSIAVPRDMFEATFRNNFKVEEGKVVAYDKAGNRLLSKQNVGEYATPDEALRLLVEGHAAKDTILKADLGSGSGNNGGGGNRGTGRVLKRSEFDKLPANKQAEVAGKVNAGEMTLTD